MHIMHCPPFFHIKNICFIPSVIYVRMGLKAIYHGTRGEKHTGRLIREAKAMGNSLRVIPVFNAARLFTKYWAIASVILIPLVLACAPKREIQTQNASGTYTGELESGQSVAVTLKQVKHGIKGQGTLNGKPFVISGVKVWSATGTITNSDGSSTLVRMYLEPGSENLVIENLGDTESVLGRGGTPVNLPLGPFSGKYRVKGEGSDFASAKISQAGPLIFGTAVIFDQFTSVTGSVVEPNKARGTITYMDESQVYFEAELSADGQNITFSGMGEPIILEKY